MELDPANGDFLQILVAYSPTIANSAMQWLEADYIEITMARLWFSPSPLVQFPFLCTQFTFLTDFLARLHNLILGSTMMWKVQIHKCSTVEIWLGGQDFIRVLGSSFPRRGEAQ